MNGDMFCSRNNNEEPTNNERMNTKKNRIK